MNSRKFWIFGNLAKLAKIGDNVKLGENESKDKKKTIDKNKVKLFKPVYDKL